MGNLIPYRSLVVSCQALEEEPLHGTDHMVAMARAAVIGNASGIRANGINDVAAIKKAIQLPVIGIRKVNYTNSDIFITPTIKDAVEIYEAGADIVALDGTMRKRADGKTLKETIEVLHEKGIPVMADISTYKEGVHASQCGADFVSTTLSGYTPYSRQIEGPDLDLVEELARDLSTPIVAEGRINTPEQAVEALSLGAHFVIVGSAITRPQEITKKFTNYMKEKQIKEV